MYLKTKITPWTVEWAHRHYPVSLRLHISSEVYYSECNLFTFTLI